MTTLLIYKNPEVTIHVYHNANAVGYCGDHADIVLPDSPTAAVTITGEVEVEPVLARSYVLTQHAAVPFWEHPEVRLPIRSTAVGDVLEIPDGRRFVIETDGFQPYTASESPIQQQCPVDWQKARPGDRAGNSLASYLLIARRLDRKWRAHQLTDHLPGAQVWLDGPRQWAVVLPL